MIKVFAKNVFAIFPESQYLIVSYCSADWVWGYLAFYHEATTASAEFVDTGKRVKKKKTKRILKGERGHISCAPIPK